MDFNQLFFILRTTIIVSALTCFYPPRRLLNITVYQKKKNVYKVLGNVLFTSGNGEFGLEMTYFQKLFKGISY